MLPSVIALALVSVLLAILYYKANAPNPDPKPALIGAADDPLAIRAIHESGHAIAAWYQYGSDHLIELSIEEDDKSQGHLTYFVYNTQKAQLRALVVCAAGAVAQEMSYPGSPSGASRDNQRARELIEKWSTTDEDELGQIIARAEMEARHILENHADMLVELANTLYVKRTLNGNDLKEFFND